MRRLAVVRAARRAAARGQSMTEYLVGLALVTAILAVPIDGHPSVIAMMLQAIRSAFARYLGAMSLPV